uniref:Glycosyltransferase n=1 Tax=Chlamydomonas leiostraca TaxID=1034604 RepID=A0A7S0RTC9_9CHLO|mmetsp:Transcript_30852/g.78778  ORF Transcript_30852/g.78778 Transcript_30852/m.78778 type:complete len:157 (+) Transcript_30852:1-471(+)
MIPTGGPANALRTARGVRPYTNPTEPWAGHTVITTWDFSYDVPRMLSPLVHPVGVMQEPFDPDHPPMEEWEGSDKMAWYWLNMAGEENPGGVIYVSFGSEALPDPAIVKRLLRGIAHCARATRAAVLFALHPALREHLGADVVGPGKLPESVTIME